MLALILIKVRVVIPFTLAVLRLINQIGMVAKVETKRGTVDACLIESINYIVDTGIAVGAAPGTVFRISRVVYKSWVTLWPLVLAQLYIFMI